MYILTELIFYIRRKYTLRIFDFSNSTGNMKIYSWIFLSFLGNKYVTAINERTSPPENSTVCFQCTMERECKSHRHMYKTYEKYKLVGLNLLFSYNLSHSSQLCSLPLTPKHFVPKRDGAVHAIQSKAAKRSLSFLLKQIAAACESNEKQRHHDIGRA